MLRAWLNQLEDNGRIKRCYKTGLDRGAGFFRGDSETKSWTEKWFRPPGHEARSHSTIAQRPPPVSLRILLT